MNGDKAMAESLCHAIVAGTTDMDSVDIAVCPPYVLLPIVEKALSNSTVAIGAQDMDTNTNGAFTGQISASMLRDCNCQYVIVGHSERRTLYGESNETVAEKIRVALTNNLTPILCLGETRSERESGVTLSVIKTQLDTVISHVGINAFERIIIAYEPVWAIGTGLTATPEQAQNIHAAIRQQLAETDTSIAESCRILYGGSMKPSNAKELIAQPDIDGGLIGGASLNAADFLGICQAT